MTPIEFNLPDWKKKIGAEMRWEKMKGKSADKKEEEERRYIASNRTLHTHTHTVVKYFHIKQIEHHSPRKWNVL